MSALGRTASAEQVAAVLEREGARARDGLLGYLPEGGPQAAFYQIAADYPRRAGKGMRPALCLATCRAYGGSTENALPAAVAIEMLHNAFLVHDDICDDATRRRGAPALHVEHGVPLALTAGNGLAWLALRPLLDNVDLLGSALALDVLREFDHLTRRTIEGQAVEIGWREGGCGEADVDSYLSVVLAKTCWYSAIHPCRIGALIGSRGAADLDAIARFGFFLGAVWQIRDDIENVSRQVRRGADFGGDVIEGKPTLLLVYLLEALDADERAEILALVGPAGSTSGLCAPERIERVVGLMEKHGAVDYACAFADGLAGAALAEFDTAMGHLPDGPDKDFVRSLVLYLRDPVIRGR
ncbi:MAG: geranylgeranyl diphosphate synthase, type [Streptomyces sp.]|nr:geranylgeranyl diphosphate synthase, type [Streptomyces sp.]